MEATRRLAEVDPQNPAFAYPQAAFVLVNLEFTAMTLRLEHALMNRRVAPDELSSVHAELSRMSEMSKRIHDLSDPAYSQATRNAVLRWLIPPQ